MSQAALISRSRPAAPAPGWRAPGRLPDLVIRLFVPLAVLLLWQASARFGLVSSLVLPSPSQVARALLAALEAGTLQAGLAVSLRRLGSGYAIGVGIGLPLGFLLALSPLSRRLLGPSFYFVTRVPLIAWIPLFMLLFGIGEALKLAIIAKAVLTPVTMNTERAMRGLPPGWTELGRALRLSPAMRLRRILLPATLLPVFVGLRLGLIQGWAALVAVELLSSTDGIGYQLTMSRQLFQVDTMLALMAVIAGIGFALDRALHLAEAGLARRYGGAA